MEFFNDIGKKLSRAARGVQELTREGMENTRLAVDLRAARSELEKSYAELGRAYYESLSGGEVPQTLVDRVKNCLAEIETLTALRDRPAKSMRCPSCGTMQEDGARFCSCCGKRMPEEAPALPEEEETDDAEYCADCGAMRRGDVQFCPVCGRAFGDENLPEPVLPAEDPAVEPLEEPETTDGYGE